MNGFFITGTDTGAGKTVITAIIALGLMDRSFNVTVRKPIETGCRLEQGLLIPEDGGFYKDVLRLNDSIDDITSVRFKEPLCPMAASEIEKKDIPLKKLITALTNVDKSTVLLVEGVGGVMAPLKKNFLIADLILELSLPVIVVAENRLGAINHTLLTIDFLKYRKINTAGIIINHTSDTDSLAHRTNPGVIAELSKTPIIGTVPFINKKDTESLINISKKYINYDIILGFLQRKR
ncbi:MAG: dethiobiotin synthase [Nitrospirae bacterium YQR-1]